MDRRKFILALSAGAALLGAPLARAECGGPSALDFVEGLYEKQVRLQAQKTPLDQQEFLELFSKGMRAVMRSPRRPGRNVSLGPVLNAFFGWGVLPGTEVATGKIRLVSGQDEGPATIGVPLTHRGETHKVLVHVLLDEDGWRVANIIYDNGKSLLDHYREMAER
ncbi:MAG: hypothetical protein DI543_06910 [Bradyrhizobium icense]|jgi:hypothetical protein|nr:MAG: hypothetical protein DI543_06910 [Bradyrhizobium icense]